MSERTKSETYAAPGPSEAYPLRMPGAGGPQPPVDDYVVEPETRQELVDGQLVEAMPALPPHGDRHSELDYVLRANAAPEYVSSTDMLTRTSSTWNFATDASLRRRGIDPATGSRYLEELAFEIKHTQSMSDLTRRAQQLCMRGVRRVFVICVTSRTRGSEEQVIAGPVMEWLAAEQRWHILEQNAVIEDPCLRQPLPVRALLDATEADNAVARALIDQGNPVITAAIDSATESARARGLQQAVLDLCEILDIAITPERSAELEALDAAGLDALRARIKAERTWPDAVGH